ncbi:MarR family winged helix-turn-helix transcriptional regulator [Mycobacterium sherrisii]|uniref:MarR family winged helix-turn-helix transcriptional regulator n=1 Tax=Mycobacterium sherrisii TaxID=243061 RepID=UPI0039761494
MAAKRWLTEDEQRAWRAFVLMRRTLQTYLARHLQREFGLSDSDFEILVNLSEAPEGMMRASELAQATQWEKSRLSHHLRRMEDRGLIARHAGPSRYPAVAITETGRNAIVASAPANAQRVRKVFIDVLGPDRLAVWEEACLDVVAAIDAKG